MKLLSCLTFTSFSTLKLKRVVYFDGENARPDTVDNGNAKSSSFLTAEGKYLVQLREKVEKAQKGPDTSTDSQNFFANLINEVHSLRTENISKMNLSREKAEDVPYIEKLEASAHDTENQINEAKNIFEKNNTYLRVAAGTKVILENAYKSYTSWKNKTDLSVIGTVFGHLKNMDDGLHKNRAELTETDPASADLVEEKKNLMAAISHDLESSHGIRKDLVGQAFKEIENYDEMIASLETDDMPDAQKIRKGQVMREQCYEALKNFGDPAPDELVPLATALRTKIDDMTKALEKGRTKALQNTPELAAKYEKGIQGDDFDKLDFQLSLLDFEIKPFLEEISAAQPPSLEDIRTLQTYINLYSQRRGELANVTQQNDPRFQELLKRADTQISKLSTVLNGAREEYLKAVGSPPELTNLLAKGADLQKQIEEAQKKLAHAGPEDTIMLSNEIDGLQRLVYLNNENLKGTFESLETMRLAQALQEPVVLHKDIVALQQLNNRFEPDNKVREVIRQAQNNYLLMYPELQKLASDLEKVQKAYKKVQEALEHNQDPAGTPGRTFLENSLKQTRLAYFKIKNQFSNQAQKVDQAIVKNMPKHEKPNPENGYNKAVAQEELQKTAKES